VDYWATGAVSAPRRAAVVGLHGLVKGKGLGRLWAGEGSWLGLDEFQMPSYDSFENVPSFTFFKLKKKERKKEKKRKRSIPPSWRVFRVPFLVAIVEKLKEQSHGGRRAAERNMHAEQADVRSQFASHVLRN
jgi:hypothetical protein